MLIAHIISVYKQKTSKHKKVSKQHVQNKTLIH